MQDAPSKAHNTWSDKNIAWRRTNWWLLMKKGMHGGISKLRHLSLLEYFLRVSGASPTLRFWHSLIFFHHLPLHTWKLPSEETHHKLIRAVSALNKLIPLSLCWKQRFSTMSTVSQDFQKVSAKKNNGQDLQNWRSAKQGRIWENRTEGSN